MRQAVRLLVVVMLLGSFVVLMPSGVVAQDTVYSDDCDDPENNSLRDLINSFNTIGNSDLTIGLPEVIFELECELVVTNTEHTLTIEANTSTTLQGGNGFRVFNVGEGATLELDGLTITGGSVAGDGGGILNNGTLTVRNSTISNNRANFLNTDSDNLGYGGGIYSDGTLVLDNVLVSNNSAYFSGGGISGTGSVVINSSVIIGNTAQSAAGMRVFGSLSIMNSAIQENIAQSGGNSVAGGIDKIGPGMLLISNSSIMNNRVMPGGGSGMAGGVSVRGASSVEISNGSIITNNTAPDQGGGLVVLAATVVEITDATVSLNEAGDQGGGIYAAHSGATIIIEDSDVLDNESGQDGGGMYSQGTVVIGEGASIHSNDAVNGAGIFSDSSATLTIKDGSEVTSNIAEQDGGGIYSRGSLHIANSTLYDNYAWHGYSGGGVMIVNDAGTTPVTSTITASTITGNNATNGGGMRIQGSNADVTITNTTFEDNSALGAGGGIYISDDAKVDVQYSTISVNFAVTGGGIFKNTGELTITGSIVAQNLRSGQGVDDNVEGGIDVDGGHNFIDGDPMLNPLDTNGGPTETMLPEEGSPVINAGGDSCPTTDQRGFDRPSGSACDIGAVEVRVPTVIVPDDMTVSATSPEGAVVDFGGDVSATDWEGNPTSVACDLPSGTMFAVGTTTVSCYTTGEATYDMTETFTITVIGVEQLLTDLIADVRTGPFPTLAKPRLLAFLETAERALERDQTAVTCSLLDSFSAAVQTYRNAGHIPASVATELRADAAGIRDVLGCQ